MAALEIVTGSKAGRRLQLDDDAVTIGREMFCGLVLDEHTVSRQHARVERENGGYRVVDLGSLNGTFVNNRRIDRPTPLKHGDKIQIYDVKIRYYASDMPIGDDDSVFESSNSPEDSSSPTAISRNAENAPQAEREGA